MNMNISFQVEKGTVEDFQSWGRQVEDSLQALDFFLHEDSVSLPPRRLQPVGQALLLVVAGAVQRLRAVLDAPFRLGPDIQNQLEELEADHPGSGKGARQSVLAKGQSVCNSLGATLLGEPCLWVQTLSRPVFYPRCLKALVSGVNLGQVCILRMW